MCELDILHDSLYQFCPELHLKRLNSLTLACHALLDCKTLTLTELGRNLPTKARTKHNIKRIDRLLGNRHLHKERLAVYRWHAREGANKQVISSQADSLIKISRIWADFFPANTS
ncbi:hypothetical protein LZE52_25565, partial [Klebsiella pneumoniae]|nr:hypothetical protein [Klebsiella pneumoniae]